jgi:quercetin dioxygenase-like cupin family protein
MADFTLNRTEDRSWQPHPQFAGVGISSLISPRQDGLGLTCALVSLPVGSRPERHVHVHADDILYVLHGQAMMWIDGIGDLPLTAGTFLRIGRGVWHQPHAVEEDLLLHNIWCPALA